MPMNPSDGASLEGEVSIASSPENIGILSSQSCHRNLVAGILSSPRVGQDLPRELAFSRRPKARWAAAATPVILRHSVAEENPVRETIAGAVSRRAEYRERPPRSRPTGRIFNPAPRPRTPATAFRHPTSFVPRGRPSKAGHLPSAIQGTPPRAGRNSGWGTRRRRPG